MATTTNYGWATPDDTDLVKDGAAAIRTLGSSADTTVKNLSPGTTAGDLDYYTSGTAKARLGIGTAGQVLAVNSGATAPEWITGGAPETAYTLLTSSTTTGGVALTLSFTACSDLLFQVIQTSTSGIIDVTFNSVTTAVYDDYKASIAQSGGTGFSITTGNNAIRTTASRNGVETGFSMVVNGAKKAGFPSYVGESYFQDGGGTRTLRSINGIFASNGPITSITITNASGNTFSAMTTKVYGRA